MVKDIHHVSRVSKVTVFLVEKNTSWLIVNKYTNVSYHLNNSTIQLVVDKVICQRTERKQTLVIMREIN